MVPSYVICQSFSIIEDAKCESIDGTHVIAIYRCSERYEDLKAALADIFAEVKHLDQSEIEVDNKMYA
jgi:hypothetical protein